MSDLIKSPYCDCHCHVTDPYRSTCCGDIDAKHLKNLRKVLVFEEGTVNYDGIILNGNTNWNFFDKDAPSRIILEYDK